MFLGVDTSNLYRPEAEDRTLARDTSHVVLLSTQAGQGTFILDTARVASTELATEVAARQLRAVVALLVARGLHSIIVGETARIDPTTKQ